MAQDNGAVAALPTLPPNTPEEAATVLAPLGLRPGAFLQAMLHWLAVGLDVGRTVAQSRHRVRSQYLCVPPSRWSLGTGTLNVVRLELPQGLLAGPVGRESSDYSGDARLVNKQKATAGSQQQAYQQALPLSQINKQRGEEPETPTDGQPVKQHHGLEGFKAPCHPNYLIQICLDRRKVTVLLRWKTRFCSRENLLEGWIDGLFLGFLRLLFRGGQVLIRVVLLLVPFRRRLSWPTGSIKHH
mmetsp:Transcript_70178/g.164295  ORF Transcript_70178/g.164295 Transcript_70178/m.164295 type:complete len:242 (+) Transcript_70178:154-879(+)